MKSLFFRNKTSTLEQQETVNKIKEIKKKYPSFKVVGKGTVSISPEDIIKSEVNRSIIERASRLVTP
jgi:hypothetical protein